jgi:glycosyltransferase involved in cell wall biosynthesis
VIVCTYNRASLLGAALESLVRQQTDASFEFEIVVVDDASTDDTADIVRAAAATATAVPIRYVRASGHGVASARNRGVAAAAAAKWIAFFDDDQWAEPTWLRELAAFARVTGAGCVCGAVQLSLPGSESARLSPICRRALGESLGQDKIEECTRQNWPGTGNVLLSRQLLQAVGYFEEALTTGGEDQELFARARLAGYRAWYTPHAVVYHIIPPYRLTPAYFRWLALRDGDSTARRDRAEWGAARMVLLWAARVGQAVVVTCPLLARASFRRDQAEILGRRYLLWRALGYSRAVLALIRQLESVQRRHFATLEFRSERERFKRQPTASQRNHYLETSGK